MATTAQLQYVIAVQDRELAKLRKELRDTNKAIGDETDAAGTKGGQGLQKFAKGAKIAAGAVLGGLAMAAKIGFGELQDAQKVSAQTEAVIKSTGGAAKVTADHVSDLAGALLKKSGVDDELIQSGANVLLTFKQIRNEAGAGNAIFDRATKATLDMSVALGQDMKSASIQVGKALNDPIRGLTALQRVGITFTDSQREQIKALTKSGKTAEAQKIILKELESQFGGSAEAAGKTLPGQLSKAREGFNNLAGSLVGALLPAFNAFAGIANTVVGWLSRNEGVAKVLTLALGGLAVGVLAVNKAIAAGNAIKAVAVALSKIFVTQTAVQATATTGATGAQHGLNAAMRANPIGIVITALAALAAVLIYAWQNSETFRDIVKGAFAAVQGAVQAFVGFFTSTLPAAFTAVKDWVASNWPIIATVISGPFAPIVALATDAFGVRSKLEGALKGLVSSAAGIAKSIVTSIWTAITTSASAVWNFPRLLFDRLIQPMIDRVSDVVARAGELSAAVPRGIRAVIWGMAEILNDRVITPLASIVGTAIAKGGDIARGVRDGIRDTFIAIKDTIVGAIKTFANAILRVVNLLPFVDIDLLAEGGVLRGPTLAIVGEDGPEAVIPLGAKRRRRGRELLTRAAQIMGMQGDMPAPPITRASLQRGVPLLAEGGIFLGRTAGSKALIDKLNAEGLTSTSVIDVVSNILKAGVNAVLSKLPSPPSFPDDGGIVSGLGGHLLAQVRDFVTGWFSRAKDIFPGEIVDARKWAESVMGKPYVWGGGHAGWNFGLAGYDCSGFASHAAKKAGAHLLFPGTTGTTLGIASRGQGPFTWGWRGMESSNPRTQHMGARILGDWYQFGSPGRKGGSDSQWSILGVPPGLPRFATGGPVMRTGPAILHRDEEVLDRRSAALHRAGVPLIGKLADTLVVHDAGDIERISAKASRRLVMAGIA